MQITNSAKYLGITITSDLSWNQHIDNITKKATWPARPPVINIFIVILIAKKLYKKNTKFVIFLLKNISWSTKYIAKANLKQAFTACSHVIHFGVCLVWLIGVSS